VSGETKVLYDIREEGAPVGGTIVAGVGGVLVGVLLLAIVWRRPDRAARFFAILWIVGWGGLAAWSAYGTASRHRDAKGWIDSRAVEVVEGVVTNFSPATSDPQGIETFQVGERLLRIEDGRAKVPGLNRSSVRGGPVRDGATLRLTLRGESILRVEELAPPPARPSAGP
jgi:hypothetical protein